MTRRHAQDYGRVLRWPLWLALLTIVGLVAGLLGDSGFDALAWTGLGIPLLVCTWAVCRRPRHGKR